MAKQPSYVKQLVMIAVLSASLVGGIAVMTARPVSADTWCQSRSLCSRMYRRMYCHNRNGAVWLCRMCHLVR